MMSKRMKNMPSFTANDISSFFAKRISADYYRNR